MLKKVLSTVLAFVLVLSMMTGVMLTASADGTEGKLEFVKVHEVDFSIDAGFNGFGFFQKKEFITEGGESWMKLSITDEGIQNAVTLTGNWHDHTNTRIHAPKTALGLSAGDKIRLVYDFKLFDGSKFIATAWDWADFRISGTQVYGGKSDGNLESNTKLEGTDWYRMTFAPKTLTAGGGLDGGSSSFMNMGVAFGYQLGKLLIDNKAYYGKGISGGFRNSDGGKATFSVTADDLCSALTADEKAALVGTYDVTKDCSALACKNTCADANCPHKKHIAKFAEEAKKMYLGVNNFWVEKETLVVEDTEGGEAAWIAAYALPLDTLKSFNTKGGFSKVEISAEGERKFSKVTIPDVSKLITSTAAAYGWNDNTCVYIDFITISNTIIPDKYTARLAFDVKTVNGNETIEPSVDWSDLKLAGGAWGGKSIAKEVKNVGNGWYTMVLNEVVTTGPGGFSGFIKFNQFNPQLADAIVAAKAYQGTGIPSNFKPTKGSTFTVTTADLCSALSDAEKSALVGTYNVTQDCSALACKAGCSDANCPRKKALAAFKAAADKMYFGFDNFEIQVKAKKFENTVTITGENADVTAVLNPATGEEVSVENGDTVKVNNFHGVTYKSKTTISSATYNGTAIKPVAKDGFSLVTVTPEMIKDKGELVLNVTSEAVPEAGKPGWISVYENNFDEPSGFSTNGVFGNIEASNESDRSFTKITAPNVSSLVATTNAPGGWNDSACARINFSSISDIIPGACKARILFDIKTINGSETIEPSVDWSGLNLAGGEWSGKGIANEVKNAGNGWYTMVLNEVETTGAGGLAGGGFIKFNQFNPQLADALVALKAYQGAGIVSNFKPTKGSTFAVTAADLCSALSDSEKTALVGTYDVTKDCSALACKAGCSDANCPRKKAAEAFQAAADKMYLGVDNFEIQVATEFFEDKITVKGGSAEITALVNSITGEKVSVTDGSKVKVNNLLGTTYEIKGVTKSVTLDGKEVPVEYVNGVSTFTIPAYSVIKGYNIVIEIDAITESTPFITGLKVKGEKKAGSTLTAFYNYQSNSADASSYQWQKLVGEKWEDIDGATALTYVIKDADVEEYLRIKVSPKNAAGATWREVVSASYYIGELGFFVATNGKDSNDGSFEAPFATVEKAKQEVAKLIADHDLPAGELVINIRGGDYRVTDTLLFTEADSGNEDTTIIYKAYNGEKVRFLGSQKIDAKNISKVEKDEVDSFGRNVLDSIIDKQAKDHIYKIDLKSFEGTFPAAQSAGYSWNGEGRDPQNKTSFKPVIVYVNNVALTEARWPNDEIDHAMVLSDVKTGDSVANGVIGYPDEEGRSTNWNEKAMESDGKVDLHNNQHWYANRLKIVDFDPENMTFKADAAGKSLPLSTGYPMYFTNILEEIDMPGESFIDRANKVIYFYPTSDDLTNADIQVSTFEKNMVQIQGADYLKFEGLDFVFTKQTPFAASGVDNLELKDVVVAHSSYGLADLRGTNITVDGCHMYDSQYSGLTVGGGDRNNAIPSGNIVKNSVFHGSGKLQTSYVTSIQIVDAFGCTISGNLLYDHPHQIIGLGTSGQVADVLIENNEIHHGVDEHGDMGSVYWGRNPAMLGITIRNNYFHENGNIYNGGWNQSVFADDGAYGAEIYGNIFWQGTITEERGGKAGTGYAFKTHGGYFFNVHDNIFIDNPSAAYFQPWNARFPRYTYGVDYTKNADGTVTWTGNSWEGTVGKYADNKAWEEYFEGTIWSPFFELYSQERYNDLQQLKSANDTEGVDNYIKDFMTYKENYFHNNVCIESTSKDGAWVTTSTTLGKNYVHTNKRQDKSYMFVDYGTDFSLSAEGLLEVQQVLPTFQNIDTSKIGIHADADGFGPIASNASVVGNPSIGGTLKATYNYTDVDGDKEGFSTFEWLESDKADGEYTPILGKTDNEILISDAQAGKFIKYKLTVVDCNNRYGNTVESTPVFISADVSAVDKTELWALITEANDVISNAVVGTENGTYTKESVDAFAKAIESARDVALNTESYQHSVDSAAKALSAAITKFKVSAIMKLEYMNVSEIIGDTENWHVTRGTVTNDGKKITLGEDAEFTYIGKKYLNKMFAFKMTLVPLDDKKVTSIIDDNPSHQIKGGGFTVRRQDKDGQIWDTKGYLLWMYNNTFELQEFASKNTLEQYNNEVFTEFNKAYDVVFGAYDTDGVTKLALYVDGVLAAEKEFGSELTGVDGYISFKAPGEGVGMVIEPADVDFTALSDAIEDAEAAAKALVVGDEYGQYPAEAVAKVQAKIADAKALAADKAAVQIPVDRMVLELEDVMTEIITTANDTANVADNKVYDLNYNLDEAKVNAENNAVVTLNIKSGAIAPAITTKTVVPTGVAVMEIPEGTVLNGTSITNLYLAEKASGTVPAGVTVQAVYTAAPSAVSADGLARFVFPGAKGKRIYYKTETGKYTEILRRITEDSYKAATEAIDETYGVVRFNGENDLVVYSDIITEFVFFEATVEGDSNDNNNNIGGGAYAPSAGNSASVGHLVVDTKAEIDHSDSFVFDDMVGHWAQKDVMAMYDAGIVSGVTETTFEPDRNITRAEFATLIAKTLGLKPEVTTAFYDVLAGDWFAGYVGATAKAGIIVGSDGTFRPNDTITRQEMAVIIMKAYTYLGKKAGTGAIDNFADKAEIAVWAAPYVDQAATAGLISGMGDGTFAPLANATRAQAVSLISRLLK